MTVWLLFIAGLWVAILGGTMCFELVLGMWCVGLGLLIVITTLDHVKGGKFKHNLFVGLFLTALVMVLCLGLLSPVNHFMWLTRGPCVACIWFAGLLYLVSLMYGTEEY